MMFLPLVAASASVNWVNRFLTNGATSAPPSVLPIWRVMSILPKQANRYLP